jgi:hypothetical protein
VKKIIALLTLISCHSNAQRLDTQDLYKLLRDKNEDKQTEFLLMKKFIQINSMKDSTLAFTFDKSRSRISGLDKEIVKIFGDTVTYIIYNPKAFVKFKENLQYARSTKATIDNDGKTTFRLMRISVIFSENEIYNVESELRREYVFKCFTRN